MTVTSAQSLLSAARVYIDARLAHVGGVRAAILRITEDASPSQPTDQWADGEEIAPDGIALTTRCEMPDGSVRWQRVMPTFVAFERATRALAVAVASSDKDTELCRAAVDALNEAKEPWHGYDPNNATEKARADARLRRHSEVFERLQAASRIEHYPATPPSKTCCHSLPLGMHEFSCRAWRP